MRILLDETTRIYQVIKQLQQSEDVEVELTVTEGSAIESNRVNVDLIKRMAQQYGKRLVEGGDNYNREATAGAVSATVGEAPRSGEVSATSERPAADGGLILNEAVETNRQLGVEIASDVLGNGSAVVDGETRPAMGGVSSVSQSTEKKPTDKIKRKKSFLRSRWLLLAVLGFLLLTVFGGGFFVYYFIPRGEVTLYVAERELERTTVVSVDPDASEVNLEERTVPGKELAVVVEDTASFNATGKKTVGERAVGEVEIRNFTTSPTSLGVAGTRLLFTTSDGVVLVYRLDQGVTVPAAQTSGDTRVAGKVTVTATATDIGAQFNIPKDTNLVVESFDDLFAASTVTFTGGLTREVTIVSVEDQANAKKELLAKIEVEIVNKIKEKTGADDVFDEKTVTYATRFVNFDQAVDAEVEKFGLTMGVDGKATVLSKTDIASLIKEDLVGNVPAGFSLSDGTEAFTIRNSEVVDGNLRVSATMSALVVPVLDIEAIKSQILGKKITEIDGYLMAVDEVKGYDINVWPALPGMLRTIPHVDSRLTISVKITAE